MDRFLDENESAASSRASSPHNFTSKVRPGNGTIPSTIHSQPAVALHSVASPTSAQSTVVTGSVSEPTPGSSLMSGLKKDSEERHTQQQSCVPTSVIVSSPESGEPPTKKLKLILEGRPKVINSLLGRPPPLKPITSTGPPAFNNIVATNASLSTSGIFSLNSSLRQEHSYLSVCKAPSSESVLFTHDNS